MPPTHPLLPTPPSQQENQEHGKPRNAKTYLSPQTAARASCDARATVTDPSLFVVRTSYFAYLKVENSISCCVMNSSSAGWPAWVAAMPRLMAATISLGSVTRSP